jgi:hypothetical protein
MQNKKPHNSSSLLQAITTVAIVFLLPQGCSTYPSKFKCGDAKGLGCTMLRDVDVQIDSGRIEEAYLDNKKCSGSRCSASTASGSLLLQSTKAKALMHEGAKRDNLPDHVIEF